ncbi:hypothetical protein I6A60_33950 [Frankia sp. AgB1.9]|uniref:hypothetical protein n=1 Tax=unclassified Frankia TaxID=2632575 RepID=UPI0019325C05|nr:MULTISPECIES: hypothetical protein [unclassified Frankia]MBL7490387.1 hypothetical protein [Frankia sp. AgW1.1]MBL7552823.1 hypothetical protein [Frankia sp. AgB1.9]MBL7619670.1 hypothetical protein [Frankia sp. AgB1.8]
MYGQGWGRRLRRGAYVGVAATAMAVLAAGCQGGGGPTIAPAPEVTSTVTAPVVTTPPATAPQDLKATDYVLTAGPETEGFDGSGGADEDTTDPAARARIAACVGVPGYNPAEPFDRSSGDTFVSQQDQMIQASSQAKILSAAQVRQDASIVTNPRFADCMRAELVSSIGDKPIGGETYKILSVRSLSHPDGITAFFRTTMEVSNADTTQRFFMDVAYFYVGQVAVELDFQDFGSPMPAATEQAMAAQITDKLTNQ